MSRQFPLKLQKEARIVRPRFKQNLYYRGASMKSKYQFLLACIFVVAGAGARADTVDQDGILRGDQGRLLRMNQTDAIQACSKHGMHLPTIRELAKISQALGSKGILELSQVESGKVPDGYFKISAVNPDGTKDEFYFNNDGYKRPEGDLGSNWFWSSSVYSYYSYYGCYLSGNSGYVGYYYRDDSDAARCVVGQ